MTLSVKTKEAIKTALAMTIAYGVALEMGFAKPMWAGFAVAMVSLATVGQSLNKAALRMAGTLVGVAVALVLIALFAQSRWLFMAFLSIWLGGCTYMMGGKKHQYFWHVGGFVCTIICMDAGPDAVNAFNLAMARAEETGLGILVYSLVAVLLWPSRSRADFEATARALATSQHQLYHIYHAETRDAVQSSDPAPLWAQLSQAQTRFQQLLDASEAESYDVWEVRAQWRRFRDQAAALTQTLEQWRDGLSDAHALDLVSVLPNLPAFNAELEARFAQIDDMLAGQAPEREPAAVELTVEESALRAMSPFEKAALAVTRAQLQKHEALTHSMNECVRAISGYSGDDAAKDMTPSPTIGFTFDPERAAGTVRLMVTMWLAFLAWIYIDALPGGAGFLSMTCPFGMVLATTPQLPVSKLVKPAMTGVLVATLVYVFVMPQLSSFTGLAVLIFAMTFGMCYLYWKPQQMLGRAFGLAMFVAIAAISNEQSYSFLGPATTALMLPLIFALLALTAHVPFSPRHERAFLRLLGRFFASCEYLTANMGYQSDRADTWADRQRWAFHQAEVSRLPAKLAAWGAFLSPIVETPQPQLQALGASVQALAHRIGALALQRGSPQAQVLVDALLADVRAWRLAVQEIFRRLSQNVADAEREAMSIALAERIELLETRIVETINRSPQGRVSIQEGERFYQLLGAYRGVSQALIDYAENAGAINWTRWHEERFG
jgi:uncharacterized membrane protein YccC